MVYASENIFLVTPARTRNQETHQQSLSLLALHTNTQFRTQVGSRLRKAGQTSATPKNMSGSDVEAKQTGRSAAWHKGARDFAQEFKPIVATLGRNLFKYSDAAKCHSSVSFRSALPKTSAPTLDSVRYTTNFGPKLTVVGS